MITPHTFVINGESIDVTINHGDPYWPFNIQTIEDRKKCRYVGDFTINQGAGWTEEPVALFYQDTPPQEGYSHYFGLLMRGEHLLITSGQSAVDIEITGIMTNDNEIIYSRYRHDYRLSTDGTVMIDGGRDYLKSNGAGRLVRMKIVKDELVVLGFMPLEEY